MISIGLKLVPLMLETLSKNSSPGEGVALKGDTVGDGSKFGSAFATSGKIADESSGCSLLPGTNVLALSAKPTVED